MRQSFIEARLPLPLLAHILQRSCHWRCGRRFWPGVGEHVLTREAWAPGHLVELSIMYRRRSAEYGNRCMCCAAAVPRKSASGPTFRRCRSSGLCRSLPRVYGDSTDVAVAYRVLAAVVAPTLHDSIPWSFAPHFRHSHCAATTPMAASSSRVYLGMWVSGSDALHAKSSTAAGGIALTPSPWNGRTAHRPTRCSPGAATSRA